MSYATMQDVWFALDLDRLQVAEPAEATPRRARGRTRITRGAAKSRYEPKPVARPRAVVEMSRAAQHRPRPSSKIVARTPKWGYIKGVPRASI